MARDWEADNSKPNPYEEEEISMSTYLLSERNLLLTHTLAATIHDVRWAMAQEEVEEAQSGVGSAHTKSVLTFLVSGLELEEQQ